MGKVIIQKETTQNPLQVMGKMAGICWNASTDDEDKNIKRALDCIESGHGRVSEFPQIYIVLDGYSARVIREFYTHIGGGPTRLQASTRYIQYGYFDYITPPSIAKDPEAMHTYQQCMNDISYAYTVLEELGLPKEDIANLLPLGMETKVVVRTNLRNYLDMVKVRKCNRAYWEIRNMFKDIDEALKNYSPEWKTIIENYSKAKCEICGYCTETNSCGRYPKKKID